MPQYKDTKHLYRKVEPWNENVPCTDDKWDYRPTGLLDCWTTTGLLEYQTMGLLKCQINRQAIKHRPIGRFFVYYALYFRITRVIISID